LKATYLSSQLRVQLDAGVFDVRFGQGCCNALELFLVLTGQRQVVEAYHIGKVAHPSLMQVLSI
jgi:hypothetical protein